MWNDIVTLYIDDASVRLLVIRSQHIRKWAEIKLEPGLIKDGVVIEELEVANRIRQLIKTQKVSKKKIILGYSGLQSLTRPGTLPKLPKAMLSEAVIREARRVLPAQLDQLYLSWCSLPGPKSRTHIFLTATPRKTADSLIKTVRAAGLSPTRMTIKPLALTKMLSENTGILVDMQTTEFDIVIMAEGVAQPIRTVTFPNGDLPLEQKIDLISADLDRTIKFFDTTNPEKPLGINTQIFVSGDLISYPELQIALEKKTGRKVAPLTTNLKGADQIDIGRYMVNLAMAFDSPGPTRCNTFTASNLNVLPLPYLPKPISLVKVIGIPAGVAVAGIALPLLMMIQNSSASLTSLQDNLNTTNKVYSQKVLQKEALKKEIVKMEKEIAVIKKNNDSIQRSVNSLTAQQDIVNGDITVALDWQGATVTLTDIRESAGNMIVTGNSLNETNVLSYARYLDKTGRFSSTTVSTFTVATQDSAQGLAPSPKIEFTISLLRKNK